MKGTRGYKQCVLYNASQKTFLAPKLFSDLCASNVRDMRRNPRKYCKISVTSIQFKIVWNISINLGFHGNAFICSQFDTREQKDMAKLIGTFK